MTVREPLTALIVILMALSVVPQFVSKPPPQLLVVGERIFKVDPAKDTAEVCRPVAGRLECGEQRTAAK